MSRLSLNVASRILVVDDDPHIRDVVCFALAKAGMETEAARDGAGGLREFERLPPDLVILDVGMPEMDGLEVCRRLRKSSEVPILFLSAHDEEIDRVLGLEIGGDDYVTKPFSPRELVARVKAILKRSPLRADPPPQGTRMLTAGKLALDPAGHRAAFDDQPISLTALEFRVLATLIARPGMVFTREQILASAYAPMIHVSDRTIDSHVRNIRSKLARLGCDSVIDTVHGVGFRIGKCEQAR